MSHIPGTEIVNHFKSLSIFLIVVKNERENCDHFITVMVQLMCYENNVYIFSKSLIFLFYR